MDILRRWGKREPREQNDHELQTLVGQQVTIKPASLHNRKRLFTTQSWTDSARVLNALEGGENTPPRVWVYRNSKGKISYVVGDGNHRIAIAIIRGEDITVEVEGIWDRPKRPYGFNQILRQIKEIFPNSLDIGGPFNV